MIPFIFRLFINDHLIMVDIVGTEFPSQICDILGKLVLYFKIVRYVFVVCINRYINMHVLEGLNIGIILSPNVCYFYSSFFMFIFIQFWQLSPVSNSHNSWFKGVEHFLKFCEAIIILQVIFINCSSIEHPVYIFGVASVWSISNKSW